MTRLPFVQNDEVFGGQKGHVGRVNMDKDLCEFLEFEENEKLFARTYKGVSYWQCVRLDVQRAISYKEVDWEGEGLQKKQSIWGKAGSLLKQGAGDIKNAITLKKSELLYFDEQFYRYADGKLIDSYFDFFGFEDRFSVQRCYHHEVEEKKPQCPGVGISMATLVQGSLYRLSKMMPKMFADVQEDQFIEHLCQKISLTFKTDICAGEMIQKIRDVVLHHKIYGKYYGWIIKKVRPRAIVVVCHYDSKLFPLYEVAHKYHVPVIELEHGLVTNHRAYNYKDLTAEGKQLPDFFFTYGDFWTQYVQLPICMKAVAIGNSFLESQRRKYNDIVPDEKTIVFYSGRIGIEQAEFVLDFYKRNVENGYCVCFKPHPGEYPNVRELYPVFEAYPEIRIIPKETDLYELLASAKHHVAVASTVLFEAAIFNVKTYVMYMPGWVQYVQPLIDFGLAKMFRDLDELQELLEEKEDAEKGMLDFIWKKNARENALDALDNIINGRNVD